MKPLLIIAFFSLLIVYSCNRSAKKPLNKPVAKTDTLKENKQDKKVAKPLKPVLGYRFVISGDFDGDGKKEILTEHFFSGIDHKETNKFYENGDYDTLVALTYQKKTYCFLSCSNSKIKTLPIADKPQLGLSYLKNVGDLDGDGCDEICYVVNWADWSSINSCTIMTYKNHRWRDLYTFEIRDWQLPDLPQTYNQYGDFGLENKIIDTEDLVANQKIEKNLDAFNGFVKKIAKNKVQIIYINNDVDLDTTIINLKKHHKKK